MGPTSAEEAGAVGRRGLEDAKPLLQEELRAGNAGAERVKLAG
jgi:hypothetical protein